MDCAGIVAESDTWMGIPEIRTEIKESGKKRR